jgi:hypothetical protein
MKRNYLRIMAGIYLCLPFTFLKQNLSFRLRKPPDGLPDFLGIGAQKSGTTWLYDQLRQHPALCLADEKEVHYFDWFFHRPLRWYLSRFSCSPGRLRGDITPGYSIIPKGRIRFICRVMPNVKLILLLRDPRARAWSSARFHFGSKRGRKLAAVPEEEFIRHFEAGWVRSRGDYETIWKTWSSVFPRKQLLVLFMEDIEQRPDEVLRKVCAFLRVANVVDEASLRSRPNKSDELEMPPGVKRYLDTLYGPMIRRLPDELKKKDWERALADDGRVRRT